MDFFILIIFMLVYLAIIGLAIAQYVMVSMSMYTIADKRGIKNAWLAWIPVGSAWVLGKVADEYDERTNVKKGWAKILLTLTLVGGIIFFAVYIAFVVFMVTAMIANDGEFTTEMLGPFAVLYLLLIAAALMMSVAGLLQIICKYKVYESIVPKKAIKYMVVSTLVPLGEGFCLLKTKRRLCEQIEQIQLEYARRMHEQNQWAQQETQWQQNQQSSLAGQNNNQQFMQ